MRLRVPASIEPFRRYWAIYGGWKAVAKSIYFYAALALTWACESFWAKAGTASADLAIDIIPSLMAFSLGGMAIVLAVSNRQFLRAIRQDGIEGSIFMKTIALFFHFLLLQTLAILAAMLVKAFPEPIALSGIAFFFLAYSITAALATAAVLFNASRLYNAIGDDDA